VTAAGIVVSCQVSSTTKAGINELKETLARLQPHTQEVPIVADLLKPGDMVVLVVPVDSAAPKGRLILPQQQTIRDILDAGAHALVTKEDSLRQLPWPPLKLNPGWSSPTARLLR
jgi:predicted GTPase